jgi:uncharacterized NAD(P)/FAD-binding protein YdhS
MEKISENPTVMKWANGIWIIKISDIGQEFAEWLNGQTTPLVKEDENPVGWAFYSDYSRFINKQVIID